MPEDDSVPPSIERMALLDAEEGGPTRRRRRNRPAARAVKRARHTRRQGQPMAAPPSVLLWELPLSCRPLIFLARARYAASFSMAMRSCRRDLTSRNAGWTVKSALTDRKGRPWTGVSSVRTRSSSCGPSGHYRWRRVRRATSWSGWRRNLSPPARVVRNGPGILTVDGLYVKFSTEDGCWRVYVPGKRNPIAKASEPGGNQTP